MAAAVFLSGSNLPGAAVDQFLQATGLSLGSLHFVCGSEGLVGQRFNLALLAPSASGQQEALAAAARSLEPSATAYVFQQVGVDPPAGFQHNKGSLHGATLRSRAVHGTSQHEIEEEQAAHSPCPEPAASLNLCLLQPCFLWFPSVFFPTGSLKGGRPPEGPAAHRLCQLRGPARLLSTRDSSQGAAPRMGGGGQGKPQPQARSASCSACPGSAGSGSSWGVEDRCRR